MKKFVFVLTVLVSTLGFSQDTSAEAKALLNQVSEKVKSYDNINIDFRYVVKESALGDSRETRGNVILEGDKYVLNILGITRIYDGKTMYTISPEDEEVTISSDNTEDENTISPSAILSFYETGYTYAMDITQDVSGRQIQYVKLTPTDDTTLDFVLLGIDSNTHHIYNFIEVSGDARTTLTVNSFKTNEPLSETLFIFDESKYSNYYINRLD